MLAMLRILAATVVVSRGKDCISQLLAEAIHVSTNRPRKSLVLTLLKPQKIGQQITQARHIKYTRV